MVVKNLKMFPRNHPEDEGGRLKCFQNTSFDVYLNGSAGMPPPLLEGPKGTPKGFKGHPKGAQCAPKSAQGRSRAPKGAQGRPKGAQRATPERP